MRSQRAIVESSEIRSRLERAADVVAAVVNEGVSLFCIAASCGNVLPSPTRCLVIDEDRRRDVVRREEAVIPRCSG